MVIGGERETLVTKQNKINWDLDLKATILEYLIKTSKRKF